MNHKRKNAKGHVRRTDFTGYRSSRIKLGEEILTKELKNYAN